MKYWNKLTLVSKILFIFWTIEVLYMLLSGESGVNFFEWVCISLFGYVFFIGISQFVSMLKKKLSVTKTEENYYVPRDFYTKSIVPTYNSDYDSMDGHQFEYFCADVLKKNGFINVEVTQGSGDHGIDVLAEKEGITYAIQCKCYSSNIGNAAVQQAHTGKSLYHKDIAVVMTNRYFTSQATEEANSLGVKLWNRDKLNELLKNHD